MRSVFRPSAVSAVFALAGFLACQGAALAAVPSQPSSVLFYPDEAQVTVEETLNVGRFPEGGGGFILTLPANVDRDSFFITVGGNPATGYYWEREKEPSAGEAPEESPENQTLPEGALLPANEPSPERRALLEKVIALREEAASRQGDLAAVSTRIALWQAPPLPQKNQPDPEVMTKLDAAFARHLPALYLEREKERLGLADARRRLTPAERELREYDATHRHQVVMVPFDGPEKQTQTLRYGYVIPASCEASYRLSAYPAAKKLIIEQEASLFQNTGYEWKNTNVFISTTRRDRTLTPGHPHPWHIDFVKRKISDPQASVMAAEAPMLRHEDLALNRPAKARMAFAPVQEEKSTFRLWSLGKQTIAANTPVRLPLASDTYTAAYCHTLRPSLNSKGFLTAELALPKALELPAGQARFFVDDASVGQREFSCDGDKVVIFFGADPQVTAVMRDLKRTTGEQGFISKEQTALWHWQITLKNARSHPVDVRVEDPAPDVRDTSIALTVQSTPKPDEFINPPDQGGAKMFLWKTTLKPGESRIIDHKVQISAPSDRALNMGRETR